MTALFWCIWAAYLLTALRWLWGIVDVSRTRIADMLLPPQPTRQPKPDDPTLTVLIAAHNEGDNIEDCLNRLRQQNYALREIIVINDRSTDTTGDTVARLAREDPRIRQVDIHQLPPGWIGKTHALAQGAFHATGDYLLFVDSDVFLRPGAIAAVMDRAACDQIDFLTLWPRLGLRSRADRLLVPAAGWLLSFWSLLNAALSGTSTATGPSVMGNGQFLLIRRGAYERIGGHAAVRAELAEDHVLATNAWQADLRRWVALGTGLYIATRNSTFARSANGLCRVIVGTLVAPWKVLVSTQIVLGACLTPFWVAPLSLYLFSRGVHPVLTLLFAAAAVLHVIGMFETLRRLFALTMEERGSLWLYPLSCLCTLVLLIWSLWIMTGRGTIRWGATRYMVQGSRILSPATPQT